MPTYQPNIPTGTVNLDVDYQNLQGNFEQSNIVYGTDHYPFDNATPNQGYHNTVTTPEVVNNPPDGLPPSTAADHLKFYTYEPYTAIGLLQWSRGPSDAIPSPLTNLNGGPINIAQGVTVPIIDLTGMTRVTLRISGFNDTATAAQRGTVSTYVNFSQNTSNLPTTTALQVIGAVMNANVLGIRNGSTAFDLTNYYWTIEFIRIE